MGEAVVRPVRGLRKRRRVPKLATERCQKPEEKTWGFYESRKRVTVAGKRTLRHGTVAWQKRNLQKKWVPGKLRTMQGVDCRWNEEGRGGKARLSSTPLLLRNRVPRGFMLQQLQHEVNTPQYECLYSVRKEYTGCTETILPNSGIWFHILK
jgi:hypothetical protein